MLLAVPVTLALLPVWAAIRPVSLAPVRSTVAEVEERVIASALFGIGTVEGADGAAVRRPASVRRNLPLAHEIKG